MRIICVIDCDNCGKSIIGDPQRVSLFVIDETYTGISKCPQCGESIIVPLQKEDAKRISLKGVKVFSWLTGLEIETIE